MGTRSFIIQKKSNSYQGVYCHWDGYPEYNGKILSEHYTDFKTISKLIANGGMSSLASSIRECNFYKDRGDSWENVRPQVSNSFDKLIKIAEGSGCEFIYYFNGERWTYASRGLQFFGYGDGSNFSVFSPLDDFFKNEPSSS